jgi:hypothetical protein
VSAALPEVCVSVRPLTLDVRMVLLRCARQITGGLRRAFLKPSGARGVRTCAQHRCRPVQAPLPGLYCPAVTRPQVERSPSVLPKPHHVPEEQRRSGRLPRPEGSSSSRRSPRQSRRLQPRRTGSPRPGRDTRGHAPRAPAPPSPPRCRCAGLPTRRPVGMSTVLPCLATAGARAGPRSGRSACLGAHRPRSPRGSGCRHTRGHPATRRPLRTAR